MPKARFSATLLSWYGSNKRDFPWRYRGDPYPVLVSEFFLQRTRAEDVVKPFLMVTEKYRDVVELSEADGSFFVPIFRGLGLFYRGERIIRAAGEIASMWGCRIPDSEEQLLKIFGIGRYSANAILCFGHNKRRAILDGNVVRIYSRIFSPTPDAMGQRASKALWEFADDMLPDKNFMDFNYALLDFGSKICTPKRPKCPACPFSSSCARYRKEETAQRK